MFMDNAYIFQIFLRMGFPTLITTDQGGEFRSGFDDEGIRNTTPFYYTLSPTGTHKKINQCGYSAFYH